MDCKAAQARLISFHFGAPSADVRTLIEAHLQACPGCLRAHLSVKHAIEEGQRAQGPAAPAIAGTPRPSGARKAAPAPGAARPLGAALLGAVLALLLAAGLGLLHRPQAPEPTLAVPAQGPLPLPRASCPAPAPDGTTTI